MTIPDRTPPHDLAAEGMVLAESLERADAFALIADKLAPEHFYSEPNRWVYAAIHELTLSGKHVDHVAVAGWLRDRDRLAQVGGSEYLVNLIHNTPVGAIEEKAARVVAFARARKLIATAHHIAAVGYGVRGDGVQEYLEQAERDVFEIVQGVETREVAAMDEIQRGVYENLVRAELRGTGNVELPTGIVRFDKRIGGLGTSRLIVVAARPSMGKTSLATGFLEAIGEMGGLGIMFSLEMPREDIGARMACCRSGASVYRALNGWMGDRERVDFLRAQDDLRKLPLYIDDSPTLTLTRIRATVRRISAKRRMPVKLIVIDYLQLMTPEGDNATREREIAAITAGLKRLARELECAVVLLSQLNRKCEERDDKRPRMADLRESGAIEQDADVIVFVYRDEFYYGDASQDRGIAELIIAKQRNGAPGTVRVGFDGKSTAFRNLTEQHDDDEQAA